jgi:hypothetical protein
MGPEGFERKNFKIRTQSTRSERRNIGHSTLASIKVDAGSNSPPRKIKHDVFKRGDLPLSIAVGIIRAGAVR